MAKKAVSLEGLLDTTVKPTETGIPQRGAEEAPTSSKPIKRKGEKRLTLALDGATYRRLRLHAVEVDQTHQNILERALVEYLNGVKA
ncbi:CopG family transcriptional regulator [Paracoccus sp. WLY502]|uniref:CopG family transcriptional regulator n=1 Tax=Paracoccus yibinensis TaxID=3068891 RepID=UPI0027964144|nr:CopG family transcriptional regulator [Paracoccus sp. WLY502]MDQ1902379.1 CopG family transcriptional regulator [Paracoccus sp. WLY502]